MKKLIPFIFISTSCLASNNYSVKIFLDNNNLNIESPNEIEGTIQLSPNTINRGESSNIIWDYEYINDLKIIGDDLNYQTNNKKGITAVSPQKTTTYDINIKNGNDLANINKKLTLTVIQPDPTVIFTANRYKIGEGQSVNLNWDVLNADSANINNNIGILPDLNGTISITPLNDTTYTLNAIGYFGEKSLSRSLKIDVIKNSEITNFSVNKNKFTIGEHALFSWNVNDSEGLELEPFGVISKNLTSQTVNLNSIGNFNYKLITTSFSGLKNSSQNINIDVYGEPTISSYTVNGAKDIYAESGDDLKFDWTQSNGEIIRLDGNNVTGNTITLKANTNKQYPLVVINGANKSVTDNVSVNVVGIANIVNMNAPSNVFSNTPFTLSWTGENVDKYELSGATGSGVGTNENLAKATSKSITPTNAGTYNYILKATNLANKSKEQTKSVIVESDPTFTGFTVNGQSSVTVSPSDNLLFSGSGFSTGAVLQGRNSANTANDTLPSNAPTTFGSYNYYGSAVKSLNGQTRYSSARSVTVNVVENWTTIEPTYTTWANNGAVTGCSAWTPAPSTVTINQSFTQTRSCSQAQTRNRQNREQENYTKEIRNSGAVIVENQTITVSQSQTATGTKETWAYYDTVYGSWTNSGAVYSCSGWTPDTSTINNGVVFTQTRSCSQNQTRTQQQRERETTTGAVRNLGSVTSESQTISVAGSQQATGTKSLATCFPNSSSYTIRYEANGQGFPPMPSIYRLIWAGQSIYAQPNSPPKLPLTVGGYTYSSPSTGIYCRE